MKIKFAILTLLLPLLVEILPAQNTGNWTTDYVNDESFLDTDVFIYEVSPYGAGSTKHTTWLGMKLDIWNTPTLIAPNLGTPTALTLTNATGLPVAGLSDASANGRSLIAADYATMRGLLGVDAAGTDNSTDVTLAGSLDYLTISGQVITRAAIDLSTDVTGTLPITATSGTLANLNAAITDATLGDSSDFATAAEGVLATTALQDGDHWTESGADIYRASGNVGIGTTSPGTRLAIASSLNPSVRVENPAIVFSANQQSAFGSGVSGASELTIASNSTGGLWLKSSSKALASGVSSYFTSRNEADLTTYASFTFDASKHNGSGALTSHGSSAKIFDIRNNGSQLFNILGGGNVGIGASAPSRILEVVATIPFVRIRNSSAANTSSDATNGGYSGIEFGNSFGGFNSWGFLGKGAGSLNEFLIAPTHLDLVMLTNGSERIRVKTTGNTGIGTASPNAKLDIATPSSGNTLELGRVSGASSIVAGADASAGALGLDGYAGGPILLNGYNTTGNVSIGGTGLGTALVNTYRSGSTPVAVARHWNSNSTAGAGVKTQFTISASDVVMAEHSIIRDASANTKFQLSLYDGSLSPAMEVTHQKVLLMRDRVGAPATPSAAAGLYSEGGEMKAIDASGNVTTISPHPIEVMDVLGVAGAAKTLGMDYTIPQSGLAVAQPKARWLEWYVEIDHETGEWTKRNFSGEQIETGQSATLIK